MIRLAATALALAMLLGATAARAERVVLVRPAHTDAVLVEAFNRLNAELRLLAFDVMVIDTNADTSSPEALEDAAKKAEALASISLARRGTKTAVDVWIGDRTSGKTTIRTLEPSSGQDVPNVLAIRAVDLLRTSLREYSTAEQRTADPVVVAPPPPADVPPALPAPPALPSSPPLPPWELRAEALVLWNRPSLGAAVGAGFGLRRRLAQRLQIGIMAAGPVVGPDWTTAEGSAALRQLIAWGELKASAWQSQRFDVSGSLSLGVHHLAARGEAMPPLLSRTDQVWSMAVAVGAHAEARLTSSAAIGLTARAIGLAPRPGVQVGEQLASVAFPLLNASVGLEVGF
ncbi:MAG TPA: hypothetical protein VJT73_05825 [Polyangiaceae bacterium]|nr:hypothetical protein [Polyangiaceae bacterium]